MPPVDVVDSDNEEMGGYHRMETRYGSFSRTAELPADVDAAQGAANFVEGVLEMTLPKVAGARKQTTKLS